MRAGRGIVASWAALLALTAGCGATRVAPQARSQITGVRTAPRANQADRFARSNDHLLPSLERTVPLAPAAGLSLAPTRRAPVELRPSGVPQLAWPIDGRVTSFYGRRGRRHHDGIDIGAPNGTAVRAAANGVVTYVGALRGYGRMIIILHDGGFATVYAHNARQHVRAGARVRRGDVIATVGRSGRTTGRNLHFEVRRHNVAYDPLALLPVPDERVARGD
jgi:murein DD-endopeptidase MepM/ murein hydrolase activator NlpD